MTSTILKYMIKIESSEIKNIFFTKLRTYI